MHMDRQVDRLITYFTYRPTNRHADRQTDREIQRDGRTDRQADWQTDARRHSDDKQRGIHSCRQTYSYAVKQRIRKRQRQWRRQ